MTPQLFAVIACWLVLVGYGAIVTWGIRLALTNTPDDPTGPLNTIGTTVSALVAAVFAAAVGQHALYFSTTSAVGIDGKSVLVVFYAVTYLLAGIASLVIYIWKTKSTPSIIRTIAMSVVGVIIGAASAYWNLPGLLS